ncbi:MerR family transcriptional regulator [Zhouia spongiae]|uniref:MerR family transcriptional regulator n=1 Tax=Zhouia spongiae TaxID=2202721 RepID=A0ABY3YIH6_9FLAO|nr:MerR family transcriptional regulator [Zhouia spongiae]UNY97427.1 MerR family transcriptional regulator [Zhouia spongiae]
MNGTKQTFSIKDLENLSGIKAHTIRIWEKRYKLLSPKRTGTNIRYYTLESLQKLLNVSFLYNNGYKISKIADINEEKIPVLVKEILNNDRSANDYMNKFKLAMINFDQSLFYHAYNSLLNQKSFREIFNDIFIPLLNEIGLLWQTNTITPAQEHFISNLIKHKILVNTEKLYQEQPANDQIFVLYLPENEIHEIGLLYLNYELNLHGYKSIYLGQTVPLESLKDITDSYSEVTFISYFTVEPKAEKLNEYLKRFNKILENKPELWLLGKQILNINQSKLPVNIKTYKTIKDLLSIL